MHDGETREELEAQNGTLKSRDDALLENMGYKAELPRNLSMISILGMSFAIMAVPFGISTTMYISLTDGQSVTVIWGWILVSLISIGIAASLAEICAVFPSAGGVYYWSAMLATPKYAPVASWTCGWLTLVGNWTVVTSINFAGAQLTLSALSLYQEDFVASAYQTVLMFWALMIMCLLVNIFAAKQLDRLNQLCIIWTIASVVIILVTLLVMAPSKRSAEFVFAHYDASASGWPSGWAFFIGLLQASYTLTGYGMVASMCDEVQNPGTEVPKAIVISVAAAGITGVLYLLPILFVLPDIQLLLSVANGQPIGLIFAIVTGSAAGGVGLLSLILGVLFFAGIGSLTAASRCTYAFARDGAIPGSRIWKQVNHSFDLPIYALCLSTLVGCLLGLLYFGSTAAFNSFTGVSTLCLLISYSVPILVSIIRGRKLVNNSSFSLGRWGFAINIMTIGWISLTLVLFSMPVSLPVEAHTMNYTSAVFAGFASISVLWYFIRGRKHFTGPPLIMSVETLDGFGQVESHVTVQHPVRNSDSNHKDSGKSSL